MKIEILLELNDEPGALISALRPISSHGANIISISHLREIKKDNIVPTLITFEIDDGISLEKIRRSLNEEKIKISEIKVDRKHFSKMKSFSVILIGHVIDTNVQDTIDRLIAVGAHVSSLDVVITSNELPSSALLSIETEENNITEVLNILDRMSSEKNLLAISEVD